MRLVEQTDDVGELRRRDSFWQHMSDTLLPNELNERAVSLFLLIVLKPKPFFEILTNNIYVVN